MPDIFMNLASIKVRMAALSTTLVEAVLDTGMTPFSNRPWGMAIARLEFYYPNIHDLNQDNDGVLCLSTIQGRAAMPGAEDAGVIMKQQLNQVFEVQGCSFAPSPIVHTFLPTILIATPKLSLYWQADVNTTPWQDVDAVCRIGFLTEEMTQQRWNEVAQTWALGG